MNRVGVDVGVFQCCDLRRSSTGAALRHYCGSCYGHRIDNSDHARTIREARSSPAASTSTTTTPTAVRLDQDRGRAIEPTLASLRNGAHGARGAITRVISVSPHSPEIHPRRGSVIERGDVAIERRRNVRFVSFQTQRSEGSIASSVGESKFSKISWS
jgi:hypothetical protein